MQGRKGIPSPMKAFSQLSAASMCTICISIPPFKYTQTDGNLTLLAPASPCVADSLDCAEFDNATRTVALSQAKKNGIVRSRFTSNTAANLMPEGPDTVTKPSYSRIAQQTQKKVKAVLKKLTVLTAWQEWSQG